MLTLSISSYAQTGPSDSVKCYNASELRKIAITFVKKQECDTLLKITNKQLRLKMEIIADQDAQLVLLKKESSIKEGIIANKEAQITGLKDSLHKSERKNKWLKVGLIALGGLTTFLIIR